jgi:steroid delta-isomerase-like uncharacterized protein
MGSAKDVVDRGLQAWRARDRDAFASCYAEDAVISAPGGTELHGRDGARMFMSVWADAFPDNELTIDREYEAGSVVVQEGTFSGTHTGTLLTPDGQSIPATGRSVSASYIDVFGIEEDLIHNERLYFDRLELLTQLGVVPEPAAAGA